MKDLSLSSFAVKNQGKRKLRNCISHSQLSLSHALSEKSIHYATKVQEHLYFIIFRKHQIEMMSSSSRTSKVAKQALRRSGKATDGSVVSKRSAGSRGISSLQSSSSALRMPRGSLSALKLQRDILRNPARYYTTEQVLKLRGSKVDPEKQKVLYNGQDEKDNCGVGLIANMKSIPSRHVVEVADEMLVRMAHRGGCGCDPASGDGAGK